MDNKLKSIARIAGGTFGPYCQGTYIINVAKNKRARPIVIQKLEDLGVYITFTTSRAVYFTL